MNDMTRRNFCTAGLVFGITPIAGNLFAQKQPDRSVSNIDDFFRDFTADWIRHDPSLATSSRYFTGDEQDRLERQLTQQWTLEWRRDRIQRARQGLAELRRFDRSRMAVLQRVSADVMDWQLDIMVREEPYLDYTFPLKQIGGANVRLVRVLTISHPLITERDAENYVAALSQVGARMDEAVEEARRLGARKIIPPRFILAATITQMQTFINTEPGQNPFVATFADRMSAIKTLSDRNREQLRAEAEKIVAASVYPAWKKGIALLQMQGADATDDAGLWRFKEGLDFYTFRLASNTSTNLTADEIYEIGLAEVRRIETEMDGMLRRLGRTDGSVTDRIQKLKLDLQYPNPTSDESRAQIMNDIEGIVRDAERRAALLFDILPKSPVVVQPVPRFSEDNAAGSYTPPSMDGSRPGIFQFPRRMGRMTKFGLRTHVYHETVPGHHFHLALQIENKELPRFRQIGTFGSYAASAEGWALYAERLAAESGWYGDDVEGLLGQLYKELFRARRLVVDTGLHARKWTRQQGIDYGIEASEVERYVVSPGQACSYMIGLLKILDLRDQAKKALGDRFSLRDFHNTMLTTGIVPLNVLADEVERYIKSVTSG
ncbi:DUF885 family protein [Candidatus Latescibacterota bacterium]